MKCPECDQGLTIHERIGPFTPAGGKCPRCTARLQAAAWWSPFALMLLGFVGSHYWGLGLIPLTLLAVWATFAYAPIEARKEALQRPARPRRRRR